MQRARRPVYAWALCDWANSAFATTVMAGFFPVFFKQYWSAGVEATESTFWLGLASSAASLVVMLLAPLLGAAADRGGARKRWLAAFTLLGALACVGLYGIGEGAWGLAAAVFALGSIAFAGANLFYDALIVAVADARDVDRVSALGYALGYLGGGLLFALNVAMTLSPATFGLADAAEAVKLSFLMVGLWWALFTAPALAWVPEPPRAPADDGASAWRAGLEQVRTTLRHVRDVRGVGLFLLAYWLYIDGVDTVIRMAVDYGLALGFPAETLIVALLLVQFVGFPAAIAFGRLGERFGPKAGILIGLAVYAGVTVWGYAMREPWEFYLLAGVIGLVQGGVQSLSRSLFARLVPEGRSGEFFGFYNMLGKFAAVLGPLLVGVVALAVGTRASILSLLLLFGLGAALLWRVPGGGEVRR